MSQSAESIPYEKDATYRRMVEGDITAEQYVAALKRDVDQRLGFNRLDPPETTTHRFSLKRILGKFALK